MLEFEGGRGGEGSGAVFSASHCRKRERASQSK